MHVEQPKGGSISLSFIRDFAEKKDVEKCSKRLKKKIRALTKEKKIC